MEADHSNWPDETRQALRQTARKEALAAVKMILRYVGEDPDRAGLRETPERFIAAWEQEWGAGYKEPIKALVKLFCDEADAAQAQPLCDAMVLVDNIAFHSHCEHHVAPFFGVAHVAYIPTERGVVGISKLARIVEHFARRLQVQERLTTQIADFIVEHISPDVGVVIKARHMCMVSRGVKQQHAQTVTSALKGRFLSNPSARAEFLALARSSNFACD